MPTQQAIHKHVVQHLRKTKDILIFVFALIVISAIAYGTFLYFYVQKKYTENPTEITESKTEIKTNLKLIEFLKTPINLENFKKSKDINYTTTGVSKGMDYYFQPKIKDSIFYAYNYPTENFENSKRIDQVIVFKYGENKHTYDDETEILIELRIFNKDLDLGKANLVGLSKMELETKFGTDYLTFDNGIAYSNENKILILELVNSKVKSYRYLKLNSDKIDTDLIRQIRK